jgi:membrane protease YdiL (CAAX protease family)
VLCVLLPVAAIRQYRQAAPQHDVAPSALYVSGLVTHAMLLLLVWLVARSETVTIFPAYRLQLWHIGVGALSLALSLVPVLRDQPMDAIDRLRAKQFAPRSTRELALFYILAVSAGFTEEMAYRGVLFVLCTP